MTGINVPKVTSKWSANFSVEKVKVQKSRSLDVKNLMKLPHI